MAPLKPTDDPEDRLTSFQSSMQRKLEKKGAEVPQLEQQPARDDAQSLLQSYQASLKQAHKGRAPADSEDDDEDEDEEEEAVVQRQNKKTVHSK